MCGCTHKTVIMNNRWNRQTLNQDNTQIITDSDPGPYIQPPPPVNPPVVQTISTGSNYPFTVNVRDSLPTSVGDDDTVTIKKVRVVSDSVQSDDSQAVPNDDDETITYSPKGNYARNALIVEMDVVPAAPAGGGENGEEEEAEAETVETFVPIEKDITTNSEALQTMWDTQGSNGTCSAMAVGATLKQEGIITDQWQVVIDGTLVLGPDGTRLNTPTLLDSDNAPPYVVQLQTQAEVDRYNREGIKWIGRIISGHKLSQQGWGDTPAQALASYRNLYPNTTTIEPNEGQIDNVPGYFYGTKTAWTESFFSHYGKTGRYEYAVDFISIMIEVYHGNPVLLRVDGKELRGTASDRFNTIMNDNDEMAAHVQSNGNHVVWLSDVATGDPDNPVFTVIDSTVPGGKRIYNIRQIIAAAEDGEFTYISAGPKPAFLQMSGSYASIAERTEPEYSTWAKEAYQAAQRHASGEDRANSDRPDEVPLPVITNEQAKAITGKNSVAEAWAAIYTLDLAKIHKYPDLVSALPNRAPFSELSHMVTNLNMAKSSIYRALGFSEATVQSLLRDLDIE